MRNASSALRAIAAFFWLIVFAGAVYAADLGGALKSLDTSKFPEKEKAIAAIVATGDPHVTEVLTALGDGKLLIRKSDRRIVIGEGSGQLKISDAATGEDLGQAVEGDFDKVTINNKIRRQIKAILGSLTLFAADAATRLKAAEEIFRSHDQAATDPLREALGKETDPEVKLAMQQAMAALVLTSTAPDEDKIAAIEVVKTKGG
ncbi:MAG: urea ABC transporter permease subunit UrtB, partial [Rhizobiales bacterium]|nr:urea ABC transporter permease subunit UrtB [Hyphomicrobiales bacterium]